MARFQITGNGIVDLHMNEVIAIRPGRFSDPRGHDDFPQNSRRIVALLNAFQVEDTEVLESFALGRELVKGEAKMGVPYEAHVEFSDDHPQFQPVELPNFIEQSKVSDEVVRRLNAAIEPCAVMLELEGDRVVCGRVIRGA